MIMTIHGKLTPAYLQFYRMALADPRMTVAEFLKRCGK